jgi:endonuclease YncB( thermonuclease family)
VLTFFVAAVAGSTFTCTPIAVSDGDGPIWCAEGPKIRLAGIAAREMDGTCKLGHPCPSASAAAAKFALVRLLGGARGKLSTGHLRVSAQPLRCSSEGNAGRGRIAAWCVTSEGVDVSCAMVATGTAARWDRYWKRHTCR